MKYKKYLTYIGLSTIIGFVGISDLQASKVEELASLGFRTATRMLPRTKPLLTTPMRSFSRTLPGGAFNSLRVTKGFEQNVRRFSIFREMRDPSTTGQPNIFSDQIITKSIRYKRGIKEELESIKLGIANYDEAIDGLTEELYGKLDCIGAWEQFLKNYEEVSITGVIDLHKVITTYSAEHPQVNEDSSPQDLIRAYVHSTTTLHLLKSGENSGIIDSEMMLLDCYLEPISSKTDEWEKDLLMSYKDQKITGLDILSKVREAEGTLESTVTRLMTKRKLLNELRARRLFIAELKKKL